MRQIKSRHSAAHSESNEVMADEQLIILLISNTGGQRQSEAGIVTGEETVVSDQERGGIRKCYDLAFSCLTLLCHGHGTMP